MSDRLHGVSDRLHPRQQVLGPGHAGEACYTGDGAKGDMTVWRTVEGTLRRMSPCETQSGQRQRRCKE